MALTRFFIRLKAKENLRTTSKQDFVANSTRAIKFQPRAEDTIFFVVLRQKIIFASKRTFRKDLSFLNFALNNTNIKALASATKLETHSGLLVDCKVIICYLLTTDLLCEGIVGERSPSPFIPLAYGKALAFCLMTTCPGYLWLPPPNQIIIG